MMALRDTTTAPADREVAGSHGGQPLSAMQVLAVGASLALIAAFGELVLLAILKFGLGRTLRLSPGVVWMAPLTLVVLFLVVAMLLVLASRGWRPLAAPQVVVPTFVFLMMVDWILVERHFSIWALLILSLGVAVQAGRLASAHRVRFLRILRFTTPALVGLAVLATVVVEGGLAWRRYRQEAALPAAAAGAPNILFIILDTVRARTLGLYGYARATTPNLERLGARGVVFDRAIAPGTWTVPTHGSVFTGLWVHQLGGWGGGANPTPPATTLAEFMGQQGYRTGGFIGNWYHIGAESGMGAGFVTYDDIGHSLAQVARGAAVVRWLSQQRPVRRLIGLYETLGRRRAPDVSAAFLRWSAARSDRPWFAFLNYMDAHSPYLPPPPFDARFGTSGATREPIVIEELNRNVEPTPERVQAERDAYDGGMAYLDDQIGRLFDELDRRGALQNTVVILTADHGEELGEHGRWGHAYSLYADVVHVPLLIFGPGVPAGVRVARPASLRGIPATIAELAGIRATPFPGISLAGHWRDAPVVDPGYSRFGEFQSLYDDRYHYLVGVFDQREHLFDHRADPLDEQDLASPDMEPVLAAFRAALIAIAPPSDRALNTLVAPPADTGQ